METNQTGGNAAWKKSDLAAILIIGEAVSWMAYAILKNGKLDEFLFGKLGFNFNLALFMAIFVPLAALVCLYVAYLLSKKIPVIFQAGKFISVGILNTMIDWGVLNVLMLLTGIVAGNGYKIFKGISFLVAVFNSFIWNKLWTFKKQDTGKTQKELIQFLTFSVIGFIINVGVASFVVDIIGPKAGISKELWGTVGAAAATVFSMTWDFIVYKFIVFKK